MTLKHFGCMTVLLLTLQPTFAATVGHLAPSFALYDSHHRKHRLADYKGRVVFVNFWASWCAPCQVELPKLSALAARESKERVRFIAINVDREKAPAKRVLNQLGLSPALEILWDPSSSAVSAYTIEGMPSSFILDAKGIVRYIHTGFRSKDPELWQHEIDTLNPRH